MRYFLDLEAAQPSQIITEIGCVRDDGKTFFSMSSKESFGSVMLHFKDFLKEDPNYKDALFYVYGTSDRNWLLMNARECADFQARLLTGFIAVQSTNYAAWFKKKYKINGDPALETIIKALDENKKQTHNALDDALMLKWLVDTEESTDPYEFIYKILVPYGNQILSTITKK